MRLSIGTPKINKFFHLEQMENLFILGVLILKHITVMHIAQTYCDVPTFWDT